MLESGGQFVWFSSLSFELKGITWGQGTQGIQMWLDFNNFVKRKWIGG
jgi:hypothetical protein